MVYEEQVTSIVSNADVFAGLISDNLGLVFASILILITLGVAVSSGVKNGLIMYFIAVIICALGVIIKAISSSILVFLLLPLAILIVVLLVLKTGGNS